MLYNSFNGQLNIGNATMEYIRFGKGEKHLIMIPGLGDGLRNLKGMADIMAVMYRQFAKDYTVWMFARKRPLEPDCTTRTMAQDLKAAFDMLKIEKAYIVGVSQGGMIAQWLAVDHPESVDKLVLVVTSAKQNATIDTVVNSWIDMVKNDDFRNFAVDNFEKSYSEKYLKNYRFLYPVIVPFIKPKDKTRFLLQAQACLVHDASNCLKYIKQHTLIIGGGQDKIVTGQESVYLAENIENSTLFIYENLGHALYEEARDFNNRIKDFLDKQ